MYVCTVCVYVCRNTPGRDFITEITEMEGRTGKWVPGWFKVTNVAMVNIHPKKEKSHFPTRIYTMLSELSS